VEKTKNTRLKKEILGDFTGGIGNLESEKSEVAENVLFLRKTSLRGGRGSLGFRF